MAQTSVCDESLVTSDYRLEESLITLEFFQPRSGYATEPRVAALRGYPGIALKKMRNPNGVASRAQIKIAFDSIAT